MVDSTHQTDATTDAACPWCSASVTAETATCPSCRAILIAEVEHDLPGVTAIDETIVRAAKRPPQQRGRFLKWFGGEPVAPPTAPGDAQAIARPDEDVQREILRLELEAQISNLQAEADSILSDALVEGRVEDLPEGLRPLAAAEAEAETPQETADALVEAAMRSDADTDADASDADPEAETDADASETEPEAETEPEPGQAT